MKSRKVAIVVGVVTVCASTAAAFAAGLGPLGAALMAIVLAALWYLHFEA